MGSVEGPTPARPKNLAYVLSSSSRTVPASKNVAVQRYVHLARMLLNQATKYESVANQEQQYVMLLRFASLIVETIPQHPDYRGSDKVYVRMKQQLQEYYLPKLEALKKMLSQKQIMDHPPRPTHPRHESIKQIGSSNLPELNWGAAGATAGVSVGLRDLGGMPATPEQPSVGGMAPPPDIKINSMHLAKSRSMNRHDLLGGSFKSDGISGVAAVTAAPMGVQYPSIDAPPAPALPSTAPSAPSLDGQMQQASLMDAVPLYNPSAIATPGDVTPGLVGPQVELQLGPQAMQVETLPASASMDLMAPSSDAASLNIGPAPRLDGLREVHISQEMLELFLEFAKANTLKSIETCALLAGELLPEHGLLRITKLIFPKQIGHKDRVEMKNEEEMIDEVLGEDLIIMGWIHTHPEFDCFLSSIDVHTTLSYQIMLQEAVAIVMAPKDKRRKCGIFRLTTPGGMDVIKGCNIRGFHTHEAPSTGQEIYEVCQHVYLNPRLKVNCKDLR